MRTGSCCASVAGETSLIPNQYCLVQDLLSYARIPPAVHQIEVHPYWRNQYNIDFCHSKVRPPGIKAQTQRCKQLQQREFFSTGGESWRCRILLADFRGSLSTADAFQQHGGR
jgi:hypothetical protein